MATGQKQTKRSSRRPSVYVTMLGEFTLRPAGVPKSKATVANLTGRARRLWMLLAFLIVNREHGASAQKLIDMLWPDVDVPNPQSTLQNNVSRLRKMLKEAGFEDSKNLVSYDNGLYYWAPKIETQIDIDVFEAQAQRFSNGVDPEDADEALKVCLSYGGDFLEHAEQEPWCVSLNIFYRSLFTTLCRKTLVALAKERRFKDIERLCMHVIDKDPSAEEFSILLMRALTTSGNPKKALDHYERIKRIFEEDYGASVSNDMEAERENAMRVLYGHGASEDSIRRFLDEPDEGGAFLCSNSVFREVVQLRRRKMQRDDSQSHVVSIIFHSEDDASHEMQSRNAKRLESALTKSLRSGDAFTKVGKDQFLVLLAGASEENSQMIMERVLNRLREMYPQANIDTQISIFDLTAI